MARIQGLEQGSDEWKVRRSSYLCSSEVSSALGMNPFKNKHQLLREKWGIDEPVINDRMRSGTEMEPIAREAFTKHTGIIVEPAVFVSDEYPYLLASLDGIDDLGKNVVEIKCGKSSFAQAKKGAIPDYYHCQLNTVLLILGLPHIHYWAFNGKEGILIMVERDEELINRIIVEGKDFYDHLVNLRPFDECIEYPWEIPDAEWKNRLEQTWSKALDDTTRRSFQAADQA